MKRQFLQACTFIFVMTSVFLQANSNPTMSRVYGNQFTPQVADTQSSATIGTLDGSFGGGSGMLSLNSQLSGSQAWGIQTLLNGNFLAVLGYSGAASVVAQYNAEGTLQGSTVSLGSSTAFNPLATMMDAQGRLLVSGSDVTTANPMIFRLNAAATTAIPFTTTGGAQTWSAIGGIAQQSTGNIIAVGYNGSNAMIARYTLNGLIDTTFGVSGFVVLNGTSPNPASTHGLYNVIVDASDNIYTLFLNTAGTGAAYIGKFNAAGTYLGTINYNEIYGLRGADASQIRIAFDVAGNIIIAGISTGGASPTTPPSGSIYVTATTNAIHIVSDPVTPTNWTDFVSNPTINTDTFSLYSLLTSSNGSATGSIYLLGSDTYIATVEMAVIRLYGTNSVSNYGQLDTTFNPTLGYNLFDYPGHVSRTAASIQAGALAQNGQLYAVGYDVNGGTTTPYVSRLNNTQYISQVAQFPAAVEQGILDQTFGTNAQQTYSGVVTPFNGLYGSSMMQQVKSAVEVITTSGAGAGVPPVGDILIGMNGFTNSSASSNMMLGWLTSTGAVDTTMNSTGYLTLANSLTNEYLTSILQGPVGLVYVAGYASATNGGASTGSILRAYSTGSTSTWTSGAAAWSVSNVAAGEQGISVGYQSSQARTLLFVSENGGTTGHISGYNSSGGIDTTFGASGSGTISTTSYGLHMGPCYNGLITSGDDLIAAYKDSSNNSVRVAAFNSSGSALISRFGTAGVSAALFGASTTIAVNNIRMAFNKNHDIVVAAVNGAGTSLLFTLLDGETGVVDTTFGSSGILTVAISGSTSLQLQEIVGVSDGTVLATFWDSAADDTMYLARITLLGVLDTSFNSQGSQPGVLAIKVGNQVSDYNARTLTAALVQSTAGANQGNIVVAGYESVTANDATPMVMRSYGDAGSTEIAYYPIIDIGVPGTLDVAYDEFALLGAGAGNVVFVYPGGNAYQSKMLVGYDNGTTSKVARLDITTNTLDTTFGTGGIYTITGSLTGISTLSVDAQNNVLVGGTKSGAGWAQQIAPDGASSVSFSIAGNVVSINQILQQQSGRYIVVGSNASAQGLLVAYKDKVISPATTLALDPTFNPLLVSGVGAAGNYNLSAATTGAYSIAINSDDTILVAYKNATPVLAVSKITADGSGLVSGFGTAGTLVTTIVPDSSAVCRVAIDSSNKVVVAASCGTGANVTIQRFTSAGGTDSTWNGTGITSNGPQVITNLGSAGITLADLMETTTQQTIVNGYNTAGGNGALFAARLDSTGALDATWNPSASSPDTAGVLTFATNSATKINASAITISGLIVSVGQQAGGTSGHPIVMYLYGDTYVTQVAVNPLEAAAGTLDSTIPGNVSGALALSGTITGVPQKIYIYNTTVNSSPNGAMLVASKVDSTGTVYLTQLNSDLSLNNNFGSSGVISFTPNASLTPTAVTITGFYVANGANDINQPIYVAGYTTTSSVNTAFAASIAVDGSAVTQAAPVSTLVATTTPSAGGIRQSSNSRVLVSGYNGSFGQVVAYNAAMTAIDTSFGNGGGTGYYTTATANPIVAMTTDNSDRIYIAYKLNSTTINIQRLLENGTALDSTFTGGTFITGTTYSASQIKMAIDLTNSQLIVAAQDGTGSGNIIQVARFNLADGSAAGAISTVTVSGAVLNLTDLFIDNNSTIGGLYPNIYVVGYVSSGTGANNSIVARIASTSSSVIALDASYGVNGIANLAEGAMTVITGAALDLDRRVYLVGSNGSTSGYMGRFFGDYYWTESYPAILQGVVGTIDLTLSPNNTGGIDLSGLTGWSSLASGYKASAIIENSNGDGSSFIAFGNGTSLIVGKVDADMNPVASFGTSGLSATFTMAAVNNIMVDSAGNIIVVGTNAGAQKVLNLSSIGALNATFNVPTIASTVGTVVAQQKSGRYIVGGYTGSLGIVNAYQNSSAISGAALPVDPTFGPAANVGYYTTGVNAQIDDLVIDSNDYIYMVYRNAGVVNVAKLTAEGALVTSANTPSAQVWSTNPVTATGITATQRAHIAINGAGNILIGASTAGGGTPDVKVALINGSNGSVSAAAFTVYATSSPILTKLVGSSSPQNEFYGSMYNSAPAAIVFAVTSAGALDSVGFNSLGYNVTTVQNPVQVNGLSIQPDGKVVMVGYTSTPTTDPILLRFYGYPYMSQYAQSPNLVAAGILDTTLWPTTGALDIDGYAPISTTITTLSGSSIARIYEYSNGKALLLFSGTNSGADCVIARVNKDLTLDTSFNTTGFVTITGKTHATSLFVDSNGNIYAAGGTSASWIRVYSNVGVALSGWSAATALSAGAFQVATQSNDRVILAGKNTNGTLYGYNTSGVLDDSFGASGVVDMGSTAAINGFVIDQYDNIITVKTASGSTIVQKVSASGLTTTLSTGTAISSAIGNAKVVLDTAGNIIVASATATGFTLARYNNVNGNVSPTDNGSQLSFSVGGSSSSVLGNIYATSDGKIALIGYETTGNKVVVARVISSPNGTSNANIVLDTAAFNAAAVTGVAGVMETVINSAAFLALDGMISADDRIMLAGSQASDPYLARVFGDTYVSYVSSGRTQGVAGVINPTFGSATPPTGFYDISTLNALLTGGQGKAIFPLVDGGYYMAFDHANAAANSVLVKTLADGSLDTAYNTGGSIPGIAGTDSGTYAPLGVNGILQDGVNNMLLVGTTGGAGWMRRYTSAGIKDTAFGVSGAVAPGTSANVVVEQTLARLVVAGRNSSGGALFAYTSINPSGTAGSVDTTFNSAGLGASTGGTIPGVFLTNTMNAVYALVADEYDRLIYAVLNDANNAVDLYRLTPSGEYDATFGTGGKVTGAIATAANAPSNIYIALDAAGNIIVAANSSTSNTFSVRGFDNGTASSGNGAPIYAQLNIASLTGASVRSLVTSADGYALVLGRQSGTGAAWIARITAGGLLDTTGFNPAGSPAGIFQYAGGGTTSHVYSGLAVNANGTLGMLGYENSSGVFTPSLVSVYDDPYTSQQSQSPDSKPVGTNDLTFGLTGTKGITFYGSGSSASYGQVAKALALYNDNNIVVAIDGGNASSANSSIFINMFDNDGLLNSNFGTAGSATVLQGGSSPVSPNFQNQYASDMITFTTASNVRKAIVAGYTYNSALASANQYSSLLFQYILTPGASGLDTANFGGFNGSPAGIAFGDGKQAFAVGQQSTGRVIVGGLSQDNLGLLLGYTSAGQLDSSFGHGGYQSSNTGAAGIYTHAIDTQNRIVIGYNDGSNNVVVSRFLADGSALDSTFDASASYIAGVTSNSNLRVAVDSSNNVYAAAGTNSGNWIVVSSYDAATGNELLSATITGANLGNSSAVYTVSKLMLDEQGNMIVVAYDTNAEQIVVMRLTPAFGLDTTFNGSGYITYAIAGGSTSQVATDAIIHPDGRIIVVGSEL